MLRLLRLVSYPQLRESWARTLLVVVGIATGVALITAIDAVNGSIVTNFRRTVDLMAGPATLTVTLGTGEIGFDERAASLARADTAVAAAVSMVRGTIAFADDPDQALDLIGVDLSAEDDLGRYHIRSVTTRPQLLRMLGDPRSIILTDAMARARGLDVGNRVDLSTPHGVETFTIGGILENDGLAALMNGRLALMDLPAAQSVLRKEGRLDQIDLVLRDGVDTATARQRLADTLPPELDVTPPAQRGADYARLLKSVQDMVAGLSALCLIAGIYVIYNTTATSVAHRALVLMGLRILGAESSRILSLLLAETAVLGAVGSVTGMFLGLALARLIATRLGDLMGIIFQARFPLGQLDVDPLHLVGTVLLGIGAAIFTAGFAARRASYMDPVEVLRGELPLPGGLPHSRRVVMWWLLIVGLSSAGITTT